MNRNTFGIFMFAIGAAAGSLATWKFVEAKYKRIADEEIASVKDVFSKMEEHTKPEDKDESEDDTDEDPSVDISKYKELSNQYKSNNNIKPINTRKEEGEKMSEPYVIPPEEFGETDYATESLTYYANKVLTDDQDNVIEDIDGIVGAESLTHFGEYEDDSVFVRNDNLATDFEILLDINDYPVSEE